MKKLLILCFSIFLFSCDKDEIDLEQLIQSPIIKETGTLSLSTIINSTETNITGKTDVPDCNGGVATHLIFVLESNSPVEIDQTDYKVAIEDVENILMFTGEYTMTDAYLADINGDVVFASVNNSTSNSDISQLTQERLPMSFGISHQSNTVVKLEMFCYTEIEFLGQETDFSVSSFQLVPFPVFNNTINELSYSLQIGDDVFYESDYFNPAGLYYSKIHPVKQYNGIVMTVTDNTGQLYMVKTFTDSTLETVKYNPDGSIYYSVSNDYLLTEDGYLDYNLDGKFDQGDRITIHG